jgi:beta-galactosidase
MRNLTSFNSGWTFHPEFSDDLVANKRAGIEVRLPHNAVDLELNYFDEAAFQRAFVYQKTLAWRSEYTGREVSLVFDGAMADTVVWINGREAARHKDGYTPFEVRVSEFLVPGDNLVSVRVDGTENPEIPPFGGQIDYLTYAGIYRDVWLKVTDPVSIRHVKIETANELTDAKSVRVACAIANPHGHAVAGKLTVDLCADDGSVLHRQQVLVSDDAGTAFFNGLSGLALWELDAPCLYTIKVMLDSSHGCDELTTRFGFRSARFTPEGFFLNGKKLKIRGLNRHQSYPYVGYAMGRRAQEKDAEILKHTLKCNLVRTSHYPQSTYFLDRCDELGLLVFEEIPGWQHIGGEVWKQESIRNVQRMIERDWNHPSIILWGVRINESGDDHDFYAETNRVARALDSTRQTGGVRCHENSEFLEDVFTMNDFNNSASAEVLRGRLPSALRDQHTVTGLAATVPYMVTEYNGHMFPTKRTDPEERQAEHVTRHLQVLDKCYADGEIAGCIGWCMADYNTHKDFGAGDRICHHGVLDIFREPKFAAYVYASQCEPSETVILKPVTFWARGEKDRCDVLPLIVLTNCDYVEFQFGDFPPKRIEPDRAAYPHLPHAPVIIDGRHVDLAEIGAWGMRWQDGKFTGFVDGRPVAEVRLLGSAVATALQLDCDDAELRAAEKDATRCIVRALDQLGNVLPVFDDVVSVSVAGPARLLGPDLLPFKTGIAGFWVETTGEPGEISVTVSSRRLGKQTSFVSVR